MNSALKQLCDSLDKLRRAGRDTSLLEIFVENLESNGGDPLAACSACKSDGHLLSPSPASEVLRTACGQLLHDCGHTVFDHRLEQYNRMHGFDDDGGTDEREFVAMGLAEPDADAVVDEFFRPTRPKPTRDRLVDEFMRYRATGGK